MAILENDTSLTHRTQIYFKRASQDADSKPECNGSLTPIIEKRKGSAWPEDEMSPTPNFFDKKKSKTVAGISKIEIAKGSSPRKNISQGGEKKLSSEKH